MGSDKDLIESAIKAVERAYAPYSNFRVGAALLYNGKIYQGFNIENISYSLTICAERVAAIDAILDGPIIDGLIGFEKIAIASDTKDFPYPCGACLQFLSEFVADMEIILVNGEGEIKKTTLKTLFPKPFKFS
ncbi:cytidine deaminase [candidate division WOR-3 bacterium]|nr:cytidine deaminase [candidate division WOR-3 bacterium]